jgi:hypothetical protein
MERGAFVPSPLIISFLRVIRRALPKGRALFIFPLFEAVGIC